MDCITSAPGQTLFVYKRRRLDVLRSHSHLVRRVGRQTRDGVLVHARLHRSHLHIVDTHLGNSERRIEAIVFDVR